jgi:hypothetical protein
MYRTLFAVAWLTLAAGCVPENRWNSGDDGRYGNQRLYSARPAPVEGRQVYSPSPAPTPNLMPDLATKKEPVLPPTPVPAVSTTSAKPAVAAGTLTVAASTPAPAAGPVLTPVQRPTEQLGRLPDVDEPPAAAKPVKGQTVATSAADGKGMEVRMLNGKRLRLGYQVKQSDSGVPIPVEVWYTRDGKTWHKDEGPPQVHSPYVMDLPEEGVYGLTLVPCRPGSKETQPPQPGDAPQYWVAVDCTRPLVSLTSVTVEPTKNTLCVHWSARDEHFGTRPITLSWSEQTGGPWAPLAANLANTGVYNGALPARLPAKFFIRVEAADQAGNVGEAQSILPVALEPAASPRVEILAVDVATE